MSTNKNKYFTVQTTAVVAAPNKTEAERIAMSRSRSSRGSRVLARSSQVERVYASEARNLEASFTES